MPLNCSIFVTQKEQLKCQAARVIRKDGSNFGLFGPAKGIIFEPKPRRTKKVAKF